MNTTRENCPTSQRFRPGARLEMPAKSGRCAFTLVEVVLATAISAVVLFGCCAMMFDMVGVLEYFERGWSLRSHADGVEKFLRASFMNSSAVQTSEIGETIANNSAKTIYLAHDPDNASLGDYYLCFSANYEHPIYVSAFKFSPDKICFLELDDDGLWIVWRFVVSEDRNSDPAIYRTLLSPWVVSMSYFYYDDTSGWEEEDEIRTSATSSSLMPTYIKIVFQRGGETIERLVCLESMVDFQITK